VHFFLWLISENKILTIDNLAKKKAPVDDNLRSFSQGTLGLCRIFILKKQRKESLRITFGGENKVQRKLVRNHPPANYGPCNNKRAVNGPQSTG
jgi:hypothetical protein